MKNAWTIVALLLSSAAWAQTAKPTLAAVPLDIDPNPSLTRFEKELQSTWFKLLDESSGALAPSRRECEAAVTETKRQDFRESDEALAKLADKAGTLYAVYATLQYTVKKQLVLSGRVVRDDGKLMKTARVELPKGEFTIVQRFTPLTENFFKELGVAAYPTFKEVTPVKEPVKEPVVTEPIKVIPPPPPPPVVVVDVNEGRRTIGTGVLVAGAGAVLIGGIIAGVGCGIGCKVSANVDANGNLAGSDLDAAKTGRTLTGAGFAIGGVGVVAAALGAVLIGISPEPSRQIAIAPVQGGAMVQFGGNF